jgi:hypothetical protein
MKKKRKQEPHPTLFVLDGTIRYYDDGSMLELHTSVTVEEWQQIILETIRYKVFVDCLKETAFPILKEKWTKEDDWWRLQLNTACGRMRNIDPLFFISINQDDLKKAFSAKMRDNATEVINSIKLLRDLDRGGFDDPSNAVVSDL